MMNQLRPSAALMHSGHRPSGQHLGPRVIDPVAAWDNGTPVVWLVARRQDVCEVETLPASVALARSACGCLLDVPVVLNRPVATWAIECEHTSWARSR